MFERGLFLSGKKFHRISHSHIKATLVYKPRLVNEYRQADAVFHIQATLAFHLENIFRIEAMANKPILQAALDYKPCGFLPGTYALSLYFTAFNFYYRLLISKQCSVIFYILAVIIHAGMKLLYDLSELYMCALCR